MSNFNRGRRARGTSAKLPSYVYVPVAGFAGTFLYMYWYFQDEAPFTRRKRLLATSLEWERKLGDKEYHNLLQLHKREILPPSHRAAITVNRVGSRIAKAANDFALKQDAREDTGDDYTYTVVRSDDANAFVLPNNHVFVLSGLFKYVRDEDELAAVLGHEIAHNLARHAGERMSSNVLIGILARCTLLIDPSGILYSIFVPASKMMYDLPHSRDQEIEADYIGLYLASDACYNPNAAKKVFALMKDDTDRMPPEFMSTHPSYDSRLSNFDKWIPEVLGKHNSDDRQKCLLIREEMKVARQRAALNAARREHNYR